MYLSYKLTLLEGNDGSGMNDPSNFDASDLL